MKRKFKALMCTVMASTMLFGCGGTSTSVETDSAATTESQEEAASEDLQKVVVGFLAFNTPTAEAEQKVEEAMNEKTKDIGVEVDLLIMDAASYSQQIPLMISGGEQVDVFSALSIGFSSSVNNGYALDLEQNDLLSTYGQGIIDTMGDYIDGCRVNGVLYGLPQNRDLASPGGLAVVSEYLDTIGWDYTQGEVNYISEEQMEEMFALLHEAYPEKTVLVEQPVARTSIYNDYPGGDWFGVLMDPENSLELTDLFETQEYLDYCKQHYEWNQKGYISADAITSTTSSNSEVSSGQGMAYFVGAKAGIGRQESTSNGRDTTIFLIEGNTDYIMASSTFTNMPWCINANTQVPEASMKLLNLFYTDSEMENLLIYGVEDVNYVVTEDGHFTYPDGYDASTVGYHPNVAPFMFNEFIAGVWEGDDLDIWEQTKEMNDNAKQSVAMGFTFDNTELSATYTSLNNIYEEYRYQLEYGFLDPETGIQEMVSKMKSAGLDEYIAEKQSQLDAWAASKTE